MNIRWILLWAASTLLLPARCANCDSPAVIGFEDATQGTELNFRHQDGSSGERFLVEFMGSGLSTFDADNDGWIDVLFLNGAALPGAAYDSPPSNQFFRNRFGKRFAKATSQANLTEFSYSLGVVAADYDNDGFQDLYINNFGANVLFRNNGDGTFSDVTTQAKVADGDKFGAGVTFLDYDQDGDLDLFSANYVDFTFERHALLAPNAFPFSPGPRDYPPAMDTLFENNGDGTFTDVTLDSGIGDVAGPSMGVITHDFDADGLPDIFVCCDGAPNLAYHNLGEGKFLEDGLLLGLAYDLRGAVNGSMGVEAADLTEDGYEELFVTDYADQLPMLFRSSGTLGVFDDIARITQIGQEVFPHVTWGTGLVDFDNDGDRDVYICSGHLLENAKEIDPRTDYGVQNTVMENLGNQTFRSVTESAGSALKQVASSRGAAFDDLDNDGDVDCVVLNCDTSAQYLRNVSRNDNHWLEIELVGRFCNRDAIGARVKVITGELTQMAEVHNGRGYQSSYGARLHFGLGQAQKIDSVEIQWPNSKNLTSLQVISNCEVNSIMRVVQASR